MSHAAERLLPVLRGSVARKPSTWLSFRSPLTEVRFSAVASCTWVSPERVLSLSARAPLTCMSPDTVLISWSRAMAAILVIALGAGAAADPGLHALMPVLNFLFFNVSWNIASFAGYPVGGGKDLGLRLALTPGLPVSPPASRGPSWGPPATARTRASAQ